MHNTGISGTGFVFRKRSERIDWRKLASVDISKILQEVDIHTLQNNIINVTFSNVESEIDVSTVDPNFLKLFKLAQLIIEYLLHSQEYLTTLLNTTEDKNKKIEDENKKLKKEVNEKNELIKKVQKENRRRRLLVESLENERKTADRSPYVQCSICDKLFLNVTFLQTHMEKRHNETKLHITKELEAEIETLKKRCLDAEKRLDDERQSLKNILSQDRNEIVNIEKSIKQDFENWKRELFNTNNYKKFEENIHEEILALRQEQQNKHSETEISIRNDLLKEIEKLRTDSMDINNFTTENKLSKIAVKEIGIQVKDYLKKYKANLQKDFEIQLDQSKQELKALKEKHKEEVNDLKLALNKTQNDINQHLKILTNVNTKADPIILSKKNKYVKSSGKLQPSKEDNKVQKFMPSDSESISSSSDNENMSRSSTIANYPRAKEAIKQDPTLLDGLKDELHGFLGDKLNALGISPKMTKISGTAIGDKLNLLKDSRKTYCQKFKAFNDIRFKLEEEVDARLHDLHNNRKQSISSSSKSTSSPVHNAQLAGVVNLQPTRVKLPEKIKDEKKNWPVEAPTKDNIPVPVPRSTKPVLTSTAKINGSSSDDSVGISLSDLSNIQKPRESSPIKKKNSDDFSGFSEEESDWDSISDVEALPVDNETVFKARKPSGSNVEALTKSIEQQLSSRKKKPAGGVDTTPSKPYSMSKQTNFDEDDFSSLSLSEDISEAVVKASRQSSIKSGSDATSVWGSTTS